MNTAIGRFREAVVRLLPFLTIVFVATCGYLWLVQPRLGSYLRMRSDVAALADRVRVLQQAADRARAQPPASRQASQQQILQWVSTENRVPEVAEALAETVLASAAPDKLRGFTIETGDLVQPPVSGAGEDAPHSPAGPGAHALDPRLSLFPYPVSYTPLRITFESTFDAAVGFLWKFRDLPTMVELRSATLTRGLPLMRTEVLIRVFQRGEPRGTPLLPAPGSAAPAPAGPTAPRAAPAPGEEGGAQ